MEDVREYKMNKTYVLITVDQAQTIKKELTSRITRAENAVYGSRYINGGFECYNYKSGEVVFQFYITGTHATKGKAFYKKGLINKNLLTADVDKIREF